MRLCWNHLGGMAAAAVAAALAAVVAGLVMCGGYAFWRVIEMPALREDR